MKKTKFTPESGCYTDLIALITAMVFMAFNQ